MPIVYPFPRSKSAGWLTGERITQAQINTLDQTAAAAASGAIFTDMAIVKNWKRDDNFMGDAEQAIIWNPGDKYWYAFGVNGTSDLAGARSYTGDVWTALTIPADGTLTAARNAVAANSAGVIIVGGDAGSAATKIRESANGTTWNTRSTVASAGANVNSAIWLASASKFIIGLSNTASTNIETSGNGQTWAQITGLPNTHARGAMATNGTIAVILADKAVTTTACLTTTDGVTFTSRTLPTSQAWACVSWDTRYERFLAFGATNWAHSEDGITWIDGGAHSVSGFTGDFVRMTMLGRIFLASGVSDDAAFAGYYDGSSLFIREVYDHSTEIACSAASDGGFMMIGSDSDLIRTSFIGGM